LIDTSHRFFPKGRRTDEDPGSGTAAGLRSGFRARLLTVFNRFRGVPVETDLAGYARTVRKIRAFHETEGLVRKSDEAIGLLAASLRRRLEGEPSTAAGAAAFTGPLFVFALLADRLRRNKARRAKGDGEAG